MSIFLDYILRDVVTIQITILSPKLINLGRVSNPPKTGFNQAPA